MLVVVSLRCGVFVAKKGVLMCAVRRDTTAPLPQNHFLLQNHNFLVLFGSARESLLLRRGTEANNPVFGRGEMESYLCSGFCSGVPMGGHEGPMGSPFEARMVLVGSP